MKRRFWSRTEEQPTEVIADAVNEMLGRNGRTRGAEVGELYLGERVLVATLRRPVVIDGQCSDVVDRTVDLFDLMDIYASERD